MKLRTVGLTVCAIAVACLSGNAVKADTVADTISNALFEQSGDIYRNRGIDRQATLLFGLSYPEHEYMNDANKVERLYREGMRQQGANDGVIRTTDLANPFTTSVRTNPALARPSFGAGEAKANEPEVVATPVEKNAAPFNNEAPRARG